MLASSLIEEGMSWSQAVLTIFLGIFIGVAVLRSRSTARAISAAWTSSPPLAEEIDSSMQQG
jgi:hypothetical protein